MLALDSLGRQRDTERPQVKYARNPNYGDDVRWLMKISRQLGKNIYSYRVIPERMELRRNKTF